MSGSRLGEALAAVDWPGAGRVLVIGAGAETDLSALPAGRMVVVQGMRPEHDALAARGLTVQPEVPAEGGFAGAVVILPRARAAARAAVAEAVAHVGAGAPVLVDGQKTDGIDAMLRELRDRGAEVSALSKAHGKCLQFAAAPLFDDWAAADQHPLPGFVTRPGVFSADGVDPGSALLAAALPSGLAGRVADLGAGWGWLSVQVLAHPGVTALELVEADHAALGCARQNVTDPRARFHWADVTRFRPERPVDHVVMNPPFHRGRAADPGLGAAFIAAAAAMLAPGGTLWMVANRQLPYEAPLAAGFREVTPLGAAEGFKLISARHPLRGAAARTAAGSGKPATVAAGRGGPARRPR